jgi:hypothetical protein
MPFGERVMPTSIFADPDKRGTSRVEYQVIQKSDKWWYERTVYITRPGSTDEVTTSWFGGYDSKEECEARVNRANRLDKESSEL